MSILLDTHVLLWALSDPERMPAWAVDELSDPSVEVFFSAVCVWEIAIKAAHRRAEFTWNPYLARQDALAVGFRELPIDGLTAARVVTLPPIHRDPFDRFLVAQAMETGHTLYTADRIVASYPGPIRLVGTGPG